MTKILIAYGTTEGQTARIADQLAEVIRSRGLESDALNLNLSSGVSVDDYDAVVIGGSIHMGKHQEDVVEFVQKNRSDLDRLPSAFFSVSLAANGDLANAEAYVETSCNRPVGVPARSVSSVVRCIGNTDFKRYMMKRIVRDKPGMSTDTSPDYLYTDWDQVRRFAEDFVERLVPEGTTKDHELERWCADDARSRRATVEVTLPTRAPTAAPATMSAG
jgi:menaquinone-dependent protoporphyrinogen oxidase